MFLRNSTRRHNAEVCYRNFAAVRTSNLTSLYRRGMGFHYPWDRMLYGPQSRSGSRPPGKENFFPAKNRITVIHPAFSSLLLLLLLLLLIIIIIICENLRKKTSADQSCAKPQSSLPHL
jgi:hypothetical protein